MNRNIVLYPYFQLCRSLLFWQAAWFLYFESVVTAAEAILLAAILDLSTVIVEVPSGYFSDYLGRRITLVIAMTANVMGCLLLFGAASFEIFVIAQIMLGAGSAFTSGTDNALLYDSLVAEERQDEVAAQEVRSWRFTYAALAVSAALGGFISIDSVRPAYLLTAVAGLGGLVLVFFFREPPRPVGHARSAAPLRQLLVVLNRVRDRVLLWIFVFAVGTYVLSHVPYVFAQPYLKETLSKAGYAAETPLVSGLIIATMMTVSVIAGAGVLTLRRRIGTIGNLMMAMSMQTGLILALAFLVHPAAIFLLVLRMVPDALSKPLILEITHPRIESGYRATYLSFQNLFGRLTLSGMLFLSAWFASGADTVSEETLRTILPYYGAAGIILIVVLLATARRSLKSV